MRVREIFFGLVFLLLLGLGVMRYAGLSNGPHPTQIDLPATETSSRAANILSQHTKTDSSGAGVQALQPSIEPLTTVSQPLPMKLEQLPARIELLQTEIAVRPTVIRPLKMESFTVAAPRIGEPMRIAENPLPKPIELPSVFTVATEQQEMAGEVGKALQQLKQVEQMGKQLTPPVRMNAPVIRP